MPNLLKLIRYKNLLFIAIVQWLIKYVLFASFDVDTTLSGFHYALLVLASVCVAAGGYIINDIYDKQIDAVNKPDKLIIGKKMAEKHAHNYYLIFTATGVGIGFYLANHIGTPGFAALFIIVSALLYLYASFLKSIAVAGNFVIALLVAVSILIMGLFDLYPAITSQNLNRQSEMFSLLLNYAFFAFFLTFIREIVKDIEDINGDKNGGLQTLPILIGRKRTAIVSFVLGIFMTGTVLNYMYVNLYRQPAAMLYFLFFIIGPMLYFSIKIFSAKTKKDYARLSSLLKGIMFFGMLSILLYAYDFV